LDLQLHMQSVSITTDVVSSKISIRTRYTTLCDKVCQWLATGRWFSPGHPVSSTNKTDHHEITEILLKVALKTIKQTNNILFICRMITTFGGDTLVELVDDDKTISCHIQNKLDRDEDVNIACCSPSKFEYKWPL